MKFWIGAVAELATMAAVWAQLIIDGVEYGIQPFIVPIRDPKTHQVYNGIIIGDCGNKNGANNIDNGYIIFKKYRIPKSYALDRLSGVDADGKFFNNAPNMEKLFGMYLGPLSLGRALISINSIAATNSSLAIAIRFVCTRRQFANSK
jgi:acyl-CoA oxidase